MCQKGERTRRRACAGSKLNKLPNLSLSLSHLLRVVHEVVEEVEVARDERRDDALVVLARGEPRAVEPLGADREAAPGVRQR